VVHSDSGPNANPYRAYFDTIFNSDIPMENLDFQLRVWVTQLVENSVHM